MKPKFSTRETTILALMAASNAALELTLGNYLHSIKFPLTGTVMVGLNLIPYTIGYFHVPRGGSILAMGIVTAFLNLVLTGAFKMMALPAIVAEAALIDLMISSGGLRRSVLIATGIASNLFSMAWALVMARILMGRGLSESLLRYVGTDQWASHGLIVLIVGTTTFHAICGAFFALMAWRVLGLVSDAIDGRRRA